MKKICRVKECNDDAEPGKEVGKLPVCSYHWSKMYNEGKPLIFKAHYQGRDIRNERRKAA